MSAYKGVTYENMDSCSFLATELVIFVQFLLIFLSLICQGAKSKNFKICRYLNVLHVVHNKSGLDENSTF